MNPLTKLAAFAAALIAVFTGGLALGATAGPFDDPAPPPVHSEHTP